MTVDRQTADVYAPVVSTANGPTSTGPLLVGVDVGGTKIAVLITTPDGGILGRATRASGEIAFAGRLPVSVQGLTALSGAAGMPRAVTAAGGAA